MNLLKAQSNFNTVPTYLFLSNKPAYLVYNNLAKAIKKNKGRQAASRERATLMTCGSQQL